MTLNLEGSVSKITTFQHFRSIIFFPRQDQGHIYDRHNSELEISQAK